MVTARAISPANQAETTPDDGDVPAISLWMSAINTSPRSLR